METPLNDGGALETGQPELNRPETMDESVKAVLAEFEASGNETETDQDVQGDQGQEADKPIRSASEAASILAKSKGQKRKVVEAKDLEPTGRAPKAAKEPTVADEKVAAPAWLPAAQKEEFEKLPPEVQRFSDKFFKNAQAGLTKIVQEVQQHKTRYSDLDRIVQHYQPEWNKRGVTDVQAIAQMCAHWHEVTRNPVKAVADLMKQTKVSPETLADFLDGTGEHVQQRQPQNTAVTLQDVQRILAEDRQKYQQTTQHENARYQAVAEVDSVRQLRGPAGNYLYPELHGEQPKGLDTLIDFEKAQEPGINWAEATKRGIHVYRLRTGTNGPASLQPRLTQQQELEKIRNGSVSVKGRGNAAIPNVGTAKRGETVKDSAAIVWHQLAGTNGNY